MTREEYKNMYEIIGAAMEVHKTLGRGLEEAIYQEALDIELRERSIEPNREYWLDLSYKGQILSKRYKADFYPKGIVVEIKATECINDAHRAQLINYLRISGSKHGMLINFGEKSLKTECYSYNVLLDKYELITERNIHLQIEE